jgi:hypothetical protein
MYVLDNQHGGLGSIPDQFQGSIKHLATAALSDCLPEGSADLQRYVVERSEGSWGRKIVAGAPQNAGGILVPTCKGLNQAGLAEPGFTSYENDRTGALSCIRESPIKQSEIVLSLEKLHDLIVPRN